MTDRQLADIKYYLPNDPDPTLEQGEYYYLQYTTGDPRVIRVFALDILPQKDGIEYGIYQRRGARLAWVDGGYDNRCRGVRMGDLYDNKADCKDQTHMACNWWESLRALQLKEREAAL